MTAAELAAALQALVAEHGDLSLTVDLGFGAYAGVRSVVHDEREGLVLVELDPGDPEAIEDLEA